MRRTPPTASALAIADGPGPPESAPARSAAALSSLLAPGAAAIIDAAL